MKEYKRFTTRASAMVVLRCAYCSRKRFCHEIVIREECGHEAIDRLAELEDLIDAGKFPNQSVTVMAQRNVQNIA